MLFMKRILTAATTLVLVRAQIPVTIQEESDTTDGVEAILTPDPDNGLLHVEMTAARQGYLAFGFSLDTAMANSLVVVGLPDAGTVLKRDTDFYNEPIVAEDARQTLRDTSISQNETHTTMKFSKLIEEEGEPAIDLGAENVFLYAMGDSNTFGYHNNNRGNFNVDLASGTVDVAEVKTYQGLWMTHGFLMAVSWALLIPIGVGVSVFRSFIPGDGTWFMIHRTVNGVGLLMMVIGFIIAFYIIQDAGGVQHFSAQIPHRLTGLVITIFGIAQGLWGFFRPHAPHAPAKNDDGEPAHVPAKSSARVAFEYGHRILGVALLATAWYNTSIGLDLFSSRFASRDLSLVMWVVVAIISIVTVGLGVKQRI